MALHNFSAGEGLHNKKVLCLLIIYDIGGEVIICSFYDWPDPILIATLCHFLKLLYFNQLSRVNFILPERLQKVKDNFLRQVDRHEVE